MGATAIDPIYAFLLVGLVSLLPLVAVMATSYTKIVVVLSLLRNALGLQNVPPPSVNSGLAIVLTVFIMYPVITAAGAALEQVPQAQLEDRRPRQIFTLAEVVKEPRRAFMLRNVGKREQEFFLNTARRLMPAKDAAALTADAFPLLVPAFALTELAEAFEVGFLIFLPFVVIDFLVAAVLMALGMQMMSPTVVSLPFKLLLFVVLNGWEKIFGALLLSYA